MNSPSDDSEHAFGGQTSVNLTCKLCGTRLHVSSNLLGKQMKCPDCHSAILVTAPPVKAKPKPIPVDDADDYQLSPETPSSRPELQATEEGARLVDRSELARRNSTPTKPTPTKPTPTSSALPVYCRICNTLLYAHPDHVGKMLRCPDCDGLTVVHSRRGARNDTFQLADVSDVVVEAGPPPRVDEDRKVFADRLMSSATAHAQAKRDERPKPPKRPLRDGVLTFAFYPSVFAIWLLFGLGLIVNFAFLVAVNELVEAGGWSTIFVAFLVPILAMLICTLFGIVTPHLITMIEYTAEGYDRIPVWPSQDLLSRGRCILLWLNAIAMSVAPASLVVIGLRKLGLDVPLAWGLISLNFLLPPILLSMLLNDSVFLPFAKEVFDSLRTVRNDWIKVWMMTGLGIASLVAIRLALGNALPEFADAISLLLFSLGTVVYCRIVGRIGWIISQSNPPEPIDDDWDDDGRNDGGAVAGAPASIGKFRPVDKQTKTDDLMGEHEIFSGDDA